MFNTLFGNFTAAQVLWHLHKKGSGYANKMSRDLRIPLNMIQKQLEKLKSGGILIAVFRGKKKIYTWDPLSPFHKPLRRLLTSRDRCVKQQLKSPDDGSHLTPSERLLFCERLYTELETLHPIKKTKPFIKIFKKWKDYERWQRQNPA